MPELTDKQKETMLIEGFRALDERDQALFELLIYRLADIQKQRQKQRRHVDRVAAKREERRRVKRESSTDEVTR